MEIRPITPHDREAVIALWRACGLTRPWNDPARDLEIATRAADAEVLVGDDGGTIVGSVMVGFDGHRGWIYYLAVAPDRQREGLGRRLFEAAEAWLRHRGAPKLQLMIRDSNVAAIAFYETLGLERQPVVTYGRRLED